MSAWLDEETHVYLCVTVLRLQGLPALAIALRQRPKSRTVLPLAAALKAVLWADQIS